MLRLLQRGHLKCSLFSFSRFRTLGSSHSWSCPPCCVFAFSGDPTHTYQHCDFLLGFLQLVHFLCLIWPPSDAVLPPQPRLQTCYLFSAHFVTSLCTLNTASCSCLFLYTSCFLFPRLSQDSSRIAGGLRARSTKLLHFISFHSVELIFIHKSNLNSSSFFRIPGFSALQSDRTHSLSGIISPNATHASGGVIIFVRQGLSFF